MGPEPAHAVPGNALIVLAGPSGSGKSNWAAEQFGPEQVVSTDALRAAVGFGEHDQRAGTDAFDLAALLIERRLKRGLRRRVPQAEQTT